MKLRVSLITCGKAKRCEPIKTPCMGIRGPVHVEVWTNTCKRRKFASKDQTHGLEMNFIIFNVFIMNSARLKNKNAQKSKSNISSGRSFIT